MVAMSEGQVTVLVPTKADQDEVARNLDLSSAQAATLWGAVRQIVHDIQTDQSFRSKQLDGPARKKWLTKSIKAFDGLSQHLSGPSNPDMSHLLRSTLWPTLGALLSHDGIERLLGAPIRFNLSGHELGERIFAEREIDVADIDRLTLSARSSAAERAGPKLLHGLLQELVAPLRRQLALEKADKGGHPERRYRNYVIQQLIEVYEQLYDKKATSTPGGEFANLCAQILTSIGLDEEGLDSALGRLFRTKKRRQASS